MNSRGIYPAEENEIQNLIYIIIKQVILISKFTFGSNIFI